MLPLQLQPQSHIPLYVQIRDQLKALVHNGALRPGDRIPASRELAANLGVHRTTVANAYAELESEGLIRGHVGRGTFIQDNGELKLSPAPPVLGNGGGVRWETLFADERGEESLSRLCQANTSDVQISFAIAKPPSDTFPVEEFRACCNAVLKSEGARILQLGLSDGYAPFKQELEEMLGGEGILGKDDKVLVTAGGQQSIDLVCKAFLRPGDTVAMENPAYPGAIASFTGARVRLLGVPVHATTPIGGHAGLDLDILESVLLQNRVKLILVTPDFQNPTGTTLPVAARRRLLEIATRYQVPIIEDHIYARLRGGSGRIPSLKAMDRSGVVIQVDSISKVLFPGLRVGWCVGPANVIERLRLVKQVTDLHTDQLAQAALGEFMRRGFLKKHLNKMRTAFARKLSVLEDALAKHMPAGVEWTRPGGGMCLWVTLPPGLDSSELLIHVRDRGVLFSPGRFFYFQHPAPNTLRLSFSSLDERQIVRGVMSLADTLKAEMRKRLRGAPREMRPALALTV